MSAKDDKKTSSTSALKQKFPREDQNREEQNDQAEITEQLEEHDEGLLEHPSYKELQQKLTETEGKATQYWERLLRMQAEMDNMSRRSERDVANAHKYALEKFVEELLPVIDNLERSTIHSGDDVHSVIEGVNLTLKMFYPVLEKFGIQQIDPVNQPFNPELHQAVSTRVDPRAQPGNVVEVLQKGYLLNNRLIRPALVVVAKSS